MFKQHHQPTFLSWRPEPPKPPGDHLTVDQNEPLLKGSKRAMRPLSDKTRNSNLNWNMAESGEKKKNQKTPFRGPDEIKTGGGAACDDVETGGWR